jgi:ATPases involved in chromosome partitioning
METKIISVISGKGGTGKSLFTAVLGNCLSKEHCKVLIVDMDIHVRGLTILLSKYIGAEKGLSVTDCLEKKGYDNDFATYRFQECEILPSVIDIGKPLSKDIENEAIETFLKKLNNYILGRYDIVLLDCRSGLDDSLVKIVRFSDFVISVSEDDDVCLQSNSNLVNYLRFRENISNIYTVINKGRRITRKTDIDRKINDIFDFNCIGVIPFDETIMEDYGKDRFWLTVYDTLYFYGVVKFWNNFREKTSILYSISEDKYSFGENKVLRNNMSRMFRLYGFIALIVGTLFPIISEVMDYYTRISGILSSTISIMGLLMLVLSSRKFRSFLLGHDDEPEKKR